MNTFGYKNFLKKIDDCLMDVVEIVKYLSRESVDKI